MSGFRYDSTAANKAHNRFLRAQLEVSDIPAAREFNAAGARMGWRNRADVPESARLYWHNRQRAFVRAMLERNPALVPVCNGRDWRA